MLDKTTDSAGQESDARYGQFGDAGTISTDGEGQFGGASDGQPAAAHPVRPNKAKRKPRLVKSSENGVGRGPHARDGQENGASSDSDAIDAIVQQHRFRRHAIKTQQKLDRSLESLVRRNFTTWSPNLPEKEKDKQNAIVKKIITEARKPDSKLDVALAVRKYVEHSDRSRAGSDELREDAERARLLIVRTLPVAKWVASVKGAGLSGLADIIGEAGDLGKYSSVAKLYKRLGFAPYQGLAGSTWKRKTWRPRVLTSDEWVANPFSGERYGIMRSLADSMFRANWIGKRKTEDGVGRPDGHYGELYARRRLHTAITHDDWSDGHAHADALRYMFKKFLRDLWKAWRQATGALRDTDCAKMAFPAATPTGDANAATE